MSASTERAKAGREIPHEETPELLQEAKAHRHSNGQLAKSGAEDAAQLETEDGRGTGSSRAAVLGWLKGALPTLAVMSALAALGYVGHHHGWKIPKFSQLVSPDQQHDTEWCEEHGVPEAECIACNADLMPKGVLHGWCKEHGVHECVLHHPESAQLAAVTNVSPADFERAARALAIRPRTKNDPSCKMHLRRIQFPSREAVDKAGIDIDLVDRGRIVESVQASGEVVYDPTRVTRLASRAGGTVWSVEKNIGDVVQAGEVLAMVDAAEIGRAKTALMNAVAQLHLQERSLTRLSSLEGVVPGRRVLEAETARTQADVAVQQGIQTLSNFGMSIGYDEVKNTPADELRRKLQFLALPPSIVGRLDATHGTTNLVPVIAQRGGIVVARDVVAGEVIDTTNPLFTVVDTSKMWLVLNVPLEDVKYIALGQKVAFRADGADHEDLGTITWISTEVDNDTRTLEVRGELPNQDGHLRNEMFGTGEIVLREEVDAILALSTAVHWEGCCHVVFVRDKDFMKEGAYKVFHTRSVRPGITAGDYTEMIAGLLPGEVIVTRGSGVLRAELLKGNLGAG
jgi:multidrug efflux pump subunit AcrA (membrane-fusion protein)